MKTTIKQIACFIIFGALTLTTHAQSSGGSGSEASDFMSPPSSLIVSIMSGEMVEGSFGSVQSVGKGVSQALEFSVKTGEDVFITSFTLMKEEVQITVEANNEDSQNITEFVLTAPRSDFRTATLASSNGANLISGHATKYDFQYKGAEVETIQVPVDPIPLRVQPFKVGHEQTLAGHTLTVKEGPAQPNQSEGASQKNKALPFSMMVLNDVGSQLYGQ